MQLIGIFLNEKNEKITKVLKEKWYGFISNNKIDNLLDVFKKETRTKERLKILREYLTENDQFILQSNQNFLKHLYKYGDNQISINSIVGKNGSGKSTILDIYNRIINNFAAAIKKEFPNYNKEYDIEPETGLNAELYYENNNEIYCIKINNEEVLFSNEDTDNLFAAIKNDPDKSTTDLEKLSNHIFYTILTNYSLYAPNPDWINNLYHKNDGYFTPIVLVPYRRNGNIEFVREKLLAEKRVQTLSLLLYKQENSDFIENYIPYKITYKIKDKKYYKDKNKEENNENQFDNYEQEINQKIEELKTDSKFNVIYSQSQNKEESISNRVFNKLKSYVNKYWDKYFNDRTEEIYFYYCKWYLKYKTLKAFVNYETLANLVKNDISYVNIEKVLKEELLDYTKINYINLKILMCKRFIENTFSSEFICNNKTENEIIFDKNDKNSFFKDTKVDKANSYDELFINLLPDFFEQHFIYKRKPKDKIENETKNGEVEFMELSDMSSGEQQLYNSLSYVVYHIKNAQSNKNGSKAGKIPYKYFNLVFDEAELYYHPEYQRCFINNIIKLFNRCKLNTNGLSIITVTHSPFILSDVPRTNILALAEGKVSNEINNTLAANIYDLLENQFFMTSTIGECSRVIIEELIELCSDDKKSLSKKEYSFYEKFISQLGDEYLRTTLFEMLEEKNGTDFIERKKRYYTEKLKTLGKD